jgi:protein TonB
VKPARRKNAHRSAVGLFDTVLGEPPPPKRLASFRPQLAAWLLALGAHAGLWLAAIRTEPSLETWSARMAALVHEDLAAQARIAIEPPAPPKPESPPEPEPEPEPKPASPPTPAPPPPIDLPAPSRAEPPAPATPVNTPGESGRLAAAETDSAEPVDFTGDTFITGKANTYAGGTSASRGTSRRPDAPGAGAATARATDTPKGPSSARPVQLSGREWRCEWPASALTQDIYEQFVVLRVVVAADGSVEQATVVSDPGQGFAQAAVACARRTRFAPAHDSEGRPIRAASPPIRVRFTR